MELVLKMYVLETENFISANYSTQCCRFLPNKGKVGQLN